MSYIINIVELKWLLVSLCGAVQLLVSCSVSYDVSDDDFPENLNEALSIIDSELQKKTDNLEAHERYIDSLKIVMADMPMSDTIAMYALYDELINAYAHFNLDSLVAYADLASGFATGTGNLVLAEHYRINKIHAIPLLGHTYEAIAIIDTTDVNDIYPENRAEFLKEAWAASLSIFSMYSLKGVNSDYLVRFVAVSRHLSDILPATDPFYPVVKSVLQYGDGNFTQAVATATAATENMSMSDECYNELVRVLSLYEYSRNNFDQWRYMLALSSILEIRSLLLDGESLRQLCGGLVQIGEIERAHSYLLETQNDNAMSGAVMRGVHIYNAVPLISENYRSKELIHDLLLYGVIALLFVLLAVSGVAFLIYRRHCDRLLSMHNTLEEANDRKEGNLGHFIALCTSYMERMEDFNRIVVRKLGAGQVSELHSLAKSGKYVDEQRRMFYDVFDEAFMNMYPTFIDDVNNLCLPERQIKAGENGKLTPELRILAFMRLGTDDGAQIARLLGLSLNTIYTYRNRAKNRAINRDTFESDVMNIGRVV